MGNSKCQLCLFSVNGSRIVPEGEQTIIEYSSHRKLYPYITYENSVLAKVINHYTSYLLPFSVCSFYIYIFK